MLPLVAGLVVSSLNKHGESNAAQPRNSGLGGLLKGLFGKKNDHQQQAKAASHLCWILTATAMLQVMSWIWSMQYEYAKLKFESPSI